MKQSDLYTDQPVILITGYSKFPRKSIGYVKGWSNTRQKALIAFKVGSKFSEDYVPLNVLLGIVGTVSEDSVET